MPYISPTKVKEIRNALKRKFPEVKFSVTTRNYSTVCVAIMQSPFKWSKDYRDLNVYYLDEYENSKFLKEVRDIATADQRKMFEDGDYGSVPNFYFDLSVGKWDRPHVQKGSDPANGGQQ